MLKRRRQHHIIEVLHIAASVCAHDPLNCDNDFVGLEIGVEEGSLARTMLECYPKCTWHGVDPYKAYKADEYQSYDMAYHQTRWDNMFKELVKALAQPMREGRFIPHRLESDVVVGMFEDNSLDLIFIDGLHTEEQVLRDITNYWPKLRKGGVMCGHDLDNGVTPGVRRALESTGRYFAELRGYVWCFGKKQTNDEVL